MEVVRRSTIDGLCLEDFRGVCDAGCAGVACLDVFVRIVSGEFSGERDGKEVTDLSDVGVGVVELVDAYRRALTRTVPDLWLLVEVLDVCEEVRSRCPLLLSSITKRYFL